MQALFKSARLQLTLFYLVILIAFSLTITISLRVLAEREYLRSNMVQRGEVRTFIVKLPEWIERRPSADTFIDLQDEQADLVRKRLNQELLLINGAALILGGMLSYWFAGRTLKPIEEAHEAQARFASDASHELRTPLTNMRLENELFLRQKDFSQAEARELITSNLEEVQRLEGLSANLLALTQYSQQTPLVLKALPIKRVIDAAITAADKIAQAKHVHPETEGPSRRVLGNQDSLTQLFSILLDNAVKYGPQKGTITIATALHDGHLDVLVTDQGPGITDTDMPFIFDRLYRGDKARSTKAGGYGLGLSLAMAIAKANNAELTAENIKPHGARFTLHIPLVKG